METLVWVVAGLVLVTTGFVAVWLRHKQSRNTGMDRAVRRARRTIELAESDRTYGDTNPTAEAKLDEARALLADCPDAATADRATRLATEASACWRPTS